MYESSYGAKNNQVDPYNCKYPDHWVNIWTGKRYSAGGVGHTMGNISDDCAEWVVVVEGSLGAEVVAPAVGCLRSPYLI